MTFTRRPGPRIVVVDDDPVHNQLLGYILEDAGYEVALCTSGFEALAEMASGCDCLITDYHMPQMNGAELIRAARPRYAPVSIVLTGSDGINVQEDAVKAGADVVLRKPTHPRIILSLLKTIITSGALLPPKIGSKAAHEEHLRQFAFRPPLQ
jgi:two-component system response regulator FixJ